MPMIYHLPIKPGVILLFLATVVAENCFAQQATTPTLSAQRIVSLVPQATEALFALGAGDKLIAVSNSSQWPDEARKKPQVGGILDPQIEQIAAMKPDLVLLSKNHVLHSRGLRQRAVPTLTLDTDSIEDALWAMRDLAILTKTQGRAKDLLDKIVNRLNSLHAKYATSPRTKVLMVLFHEEPPFDEVLAVAPGNYLDEILRVAGGDNVVKTWDIEGGLTVRLNGRQIRSADPEVIIDLRPDAINAQQQEALEAQWKQMVGDNVRIILRHDPYLAIPGVRMPESIETLANWIHAPATQPTQPMKQGGSSTRQSVPLAKP